MAQEKAKKILEAMLANDAFSKWLGVDVADIGPGFCRLRMVVRAEMLNGFGIAHGGITYALADSAFAFASNSHGRKAVSIDTGIAHLQPLKEGQQITAEAKEVSLSNKIGLYHVEVFCDQNQHIASFKGTVYRTSRLWEVEDHNT